ncbi:cupredoxin family protein [Viridibacterium curvum]
MKILLTLLFLLGCGAAFAHGDNHAGKATTTREQTAWGIAGQPKAVRRTIDIRMDDQMRFTPDRLQVRRGDTLRLRIHNSGQVLHELVIGTPAALAEHAALMQRFPNMEHDEPWMAHVPPGKTGELVWQFNRAGDFEFACLIAGHYQAGMRGRVTVKP